MNIGIDLRPLLSSVRTGVAEYTYELLDALFKIDQTNQYFLFYNSAKEKLEISNWKLSRRVGRDPDFTSGETGKVRFVRTKYPNKLFNASISLFARPRLDRIRNKELGIRNIDVWFSPNINFTTLSKGVKHILTIHDLSFEHFPDCYSAKRRLWHRALNPRKQCERADLILTPSESTRRVVVETYGIEEKKVKVLYPGLSSAFSGQRSADGERGNEKREMVKKKYNLPDRFILFLGTIEPRKNILGLIEAYKHLSQMSNVKCQMLIAGPLGWKYEPIRKAIAETPGARYIGYVLPEDKPAFYQLASFFVYPSLYEGLGFPVLEAMAAGTPVITSNRSSLTEVAGDAAYLVNPDNVSELARALELLLIDEKLRAFLIERGKRRAAEFRWEDSTRELMRLFTDS